MHSREGRVAYPVSQDEITSLEVLASLGFLVGCQIGVKKHLFRFEKAFLVCSSLKL